MRKREKWILSLYREESDSCLLFPLLRGENCAPWRRDGKDPGSSLTFWNIRTSLQGQQSHGSLWLFMTYRCRWGPGPHFLWKYKRTFRVQWIAWNALTILPQEAKFSENFIQKAQMVQKHKNIFLYPISSQLLLRRVGVKEDYLWCGQTVVSDTAFWESCRF